MNFCKHCGRKLDGAPKFCPSCGNTLTPPEATFVEQQPAQPVNRPPSATGNSYEESTATSYQTGRRAVDSSRRQPAKKKEVPVFPCVLAVCACLFFLVLKDDDSSSSSSRSSSGSSSTSDIIPDFGIKVAKEYAGNNIISVSNNLQNAVWSESYLGDGEYKITLSGYASLYSEDIVLTFDLTNVDPTGNSTTAMSECNLKSIFLKSSGKYLTEISDITLFLSRMSQ